MPCSSFTTPGANSRSEHESSGQTRLDVINSLDAPFEGQESGLFRTIGLTIAIIGWFYVFGAQTNRDSFGLATFGDRILVPAFVLPLVFAGQVDPMLVLPVAIVDPILGTGAFVIWKRQSTF